jgi:hypothetical protein
MRLKRVFFVLIFCWSILGHSQEHCGEQLPFPELEKLQQVAHSIAWFGANEPQIKNAFCSRKSSFTPDEMKSWINTNQSPTRMSQTINGIQFHNESPDNLETFRILTSRFDDFNKPIPEQKRYSSRCNKVDCALKEIFGETSLQLQFMQQRYGMNGSHIKVGEAKARPWKKNELDTILLALADIPEGLLNYNKNKTLVHHPDEVQHSNFANATITIFNHWNTASFPRQKYTLVHEIAHNLGILSKLDQSDEWKSFSGWSPGGMYGKKNNASMPETVISTYGLENEMEDFAETVSAYRYNPETLKKVSPEKYKLMKDVIFDQVEYTSEKACTDPKRASEAIKKHALEEVAKRSKDPGMLLEIANRCSDTVLYDLATREPRNFDFSRFKDCYQASLSEQILKLMKAKTNTSAFKNMLNSSGVKLNPLLEQEILTAAASLHAKKFKSQIDNIKQQPRNCWILNKKSAYEVMDVRELGISNNENSSNLKSLGLRVCEMN